MEIFKPLRSLQEVRLVGLTCQPWGNINEWRMSTRRAICSHALKLEGKKWMLTEIAMP